MYKLFIVDDESIEREAMRQILSRGMKDVEIVGEAANGNEAIRLTDEWVPDIILMDIKMPGVDGVEAVKIIRKSHPDMKFIMVSAYDTFEYARQVMHEGVKEYLLKPSKREEIVATVQRVIEEVATQRKEKQLLEEAGIRLTRAVDETQKPSDEVYGRLQEARRYIDEHYYEKIGLENVAGYVDLSPYYFSKLFKEQNRVSFIDYLTEIRIRSGKELLRQSHLNLKEICFRIGYHDPNYFSRVFKKVTGCSPKAYRRSLDKGRSPQNNEEIRKNI